MKKQLFKHLMGGMLMMAMPLMFTSCEGTLDDIFGEWSRPTGNNSTGNNGNTKTTVAVKSVTLDQTTLTKAVGDDAVTLTATVDPSDASDKTVTWKSSDASIAAVDANGKVTFEAAGTATITATATNGTDDTADDKTATCEVTISAKKVNVESVKLDQTTLTATAGDAAVTLTATVTPDDATDKTVKWTSSDESVVTVVDGVVTIVAAGTATITATAPNGTDDTADDKTATCEVTISAKKVNVESVKLDQPTLTATVGDAAVTLTATVTPDDATDKTVKWTSSNESVATVADGVVTFVAAGTATITATAPNGTDDTADDKTAECAVTVNAAAAKVTTAPTATTGTIAAGSTTALVTAGVADGGTMMYEATATNTKPTSTDGFSATIPTAATLAAGTYYVWYYAKADAQHADSEIAATAIEVTVTVVYAATEYKEALWDGTKVVFTKQTAASVTAVTDATANVIWNAGWYTVSGNVTITGNVKLTADTHLILQDGATLTINGQLDCRTNYKNLYIYGQKKGDGKLNVTYNSDNAINSFDGYHIDIHGGEVTAKATTNGYGLNTGYLAVYGGKLTATSGGESGIQFYNTIDVYDGEVVATSNATSGARYGIRSSEVTSSKILTVYGGKVTATGNGIKGSNNYYGSGFRCYVKSDTSGIKFYFSDNGTTWGDGTPYASATKVGTPVAATEKRYAKAE